MPVVSVIIPTFNGEEYIADCMQSILHQTFRDIEIIVIDDGSADATGEIIKSFFDDRIVYQRLEKNKGTAAATNAGHDLAAGKYIAHIDQDDIALPDRLERQVSFLEKFSDVDVLGGWMETFGAISGKVARVPVSDGEIKANFLSGTLNINNPTAMFRHSLIKTNKPGFGGSLDWGFWVQAMFRGHVSPTLTES
jgi:glycosyltransferase involved in cell wall biosynthesis